MSSTRLLIVHPDPSVVTLMTSMLQSLGHRIDEASSDRAAVRMLEREPYDLVLAGADPFDPDALELLEYVRRKHPRTRVILVFPVAHADRSRDATVRGAAGVVRFPVPATQLRASVAQALGQEEGGPVATAVRPAAAAAAAIGESKPAGTNGHHPALEIKPPVADGHPAPAVVASGQVEVAGLIGDDPSWRQALELAQTIAPTRAPVLITGERGTGKSLVACTLHNQSPRRDGPFVELYCGAMKEAVFEAELFGRKAGNFADPLAERPGKLAQAQGGTLFLDDVASLSPALQFKLLRLLQDGQFEPIGSTQTVRADVRLILGTCQPLATLVEQGKFRQDLYYRISVVTLKLPPLRHRGTDIERLADHFRARYASELGKDVAGFAPEALEQLRSYDWPGNVLELQNVIERAIILCRGPRIEPSLLALGGDEAPALRGASHAPRPHVSPGIRPLKKALEEPEKQIILQALEALNWNRQETARLLDINRTTLYKKMKKYNLLFDEPAWV